MSSKTPVLDSLPDASSGESDLFLEPPRNHLASYSETAADQNIFQGLLRSAKGPRRVQNAHEDMTLFRTESFSQERQLSKATRKTLKENDRKRRILEAVDKNDVSPGNCVQRLEVVVPKQMFEDRSKKDILKQLRLFIRPEQISYDDCPMNNLISWRLKPDASSSSPSSFVLCSLLVFKAEQYVDHFRKKTLDDLCLGLKSKLPSQKVMLAVSGMDNYCKRMERNALKSGARSDLVITKEAIQDSYVMLYMDYEIRTHDIQKHDELSDYIYDISRAVAKTPNYKEQAYLESISTYRRKKAARVVVPPVSMLDTLGSSRINDESNDEKLSDKSSSEVFGSNLKAAYLQMLSLIPGISPDTARAIQDKYPTLKILHRAIQSSGSNVTMFSDLKHPKSNKSIGRKTSERIVKVFTSLDPNECVK